MKNNSGNTIEFTLIYNRYKKGLYNYVRKMIGEQMASEDIVQNIFMRLYEKRNEINNKESIKFWLFKSARNEVYSFFRKKKTHVDQYKVEDVDEIEIYSEEKVSEYLDFIETKNAVEAALGKMPAEQKEIFIMKEYGGLSYKEIASVFEIDENLVKSRLYNVRQRLIVVLQKKFKHEE